MNQVDSIITKLGLDVKEFQDKLKLANRNLDAFGKQAADAAGKAKKETKKTTDQVNSLRGALKGLSMEFPILGRMGELVMNPIAMAVAGVSAAFAIWRKRVSEANEDFQAMKLPDVITKASERMSPAIGFWNLYAAAIAKARNELFGLEGQHKNTLAGISRRFDLMRQFTGDDPAMDKRQSGEIANEKGRQAFALSNRGAQRLAEAQRLRRKIGGVDEATITSQNKVDDSIISAETAKLNKLKERLAGVDESGISLMDRADAMMSFRLDREVFEERRANIQGEISRAQTNIDAATSRKSSRELKFKEATSRIKDLMGGAADDQIASGKLLAEGKDQWLQANIKQGIERLKSGKTLMPSVMGGGQSTSVEAVNAIRMAAIEAGLIKNGQAMSEDALRNMGEKLGARMLPGQTPQERMNGIMTELLDMAKGKGLAVQARNGK